MTKAQALLSFLEEYKVIVALHNPGSPEQKEYYVNTHIFNFELWDVPSDDPIVSESKVAKSYVGLFNNAIVIDKKAIRKFNSSKERISIERNNAAKIYIPDSVWNQLKISKPRDDQKLLLQCLNILFKLYGVRIFGMEDFNNIKRFWE
jgi:hypothetical protein